MKQYGALILGTPLTGTVAVNILRGQLSIAVVEDHTTITLDELQTAELRNWLNEELE